MVTTTGYQSGAQRVADSYGIVILELHVPTEHDLANRWRSIRIELVARMPQVSDLEVDAVEQLSPSSRLSGTLGRFVLEFGDGTTDLLMDHLLRGELGPLGEPPVDAHPVTRTFAPPALLRYGDQPQARVTELRATVGEAQAEPVLVQTPTGKVAWMLADSLGGSRTWFATDGRIWQTPS